MADPVPPPNPAAPPASAPPKVESAAPAPPKIESAAPAPPAPAPPKVVIADVAPVAIDAAPATFTVGELLERKTDLRPSLRAGFLARLKASKVKLADRMTADEFDQALDDALHGRA